MSRRATHHLHNLRLLEGPPGKPKGSVMVCCEAFWNLQMWQRVDFVTDRKSVGRGLHNLACPIPMCGQAIELDKNDIKRQMVEFANHVPEESEGAWVLFTDLPSRGVL